MSAPTLKLPRGADELLRDLPMTEPDFEAQALAIEARLQQKVGAAPLELLGTPALTPEADEPPAGSGAQSTPLPKGSFAEMARKSLQRKEDDEGAALAKELLAATSQTRRHDAEMVARVRAAGKAPTATPLPQGERPSGVVSRLEAPAIPAAAAPHAASSTKRGVVISFAGALAIAAAFALFLRSGSNEPTPAPSAALEPHDSAAAPARVGADGAHPSSAAPSPSADGVIDPEALAVAANDPKPSDAKAGSAKSPVGGAAAPAPKSAVTPGGGAAKPEAAAADSEAHVAAPAVPPRNAEQTPEPPLKPAEGSADNLPLSPSSGAVSTALGAVRSNAQACLAGQSEPVKAVVIFSSDGRVSSVSAAGPSGACIQAALSKAHLGPFAKDHFSATTTIRPP
ncbi:MAG TPA: hypothetical protein VEQ59_15785 [Polyangiaceae bacterium]|nr:hypothetical protein [Polyangiaceae bacterium]